MRFQLNLFLFEVDICYMNVDHSMLYGQRGECNISKRLPPLNTLIVVLFSFLCNFFV